MIDLVLAGDNAIVIGLAAAGLPRETAQPRDPRRHHRGHSPPHRLCLGDRHAARDRRVAAGRRHSAALGLLEDVARVAHLAQRRAAATEAIAHRDLNADGTIAGGAVRKTFRQAATQIVIADVSMSLDNVLAVAGASREHPWVLVFGLVMSIALMGLAASFIARLLGRYRWIAYIGLVIILYVALKMIYDGWIEVEPHIAKCCLAS